MTRPPIRRLGALTVIVAVLAAVLAACTGGGSEPPAAPTSEVGFPVTLTSNGVKVTIAKAPSRIVSLSPTATEMLFAIGAGDQILGVDDQSNYPPEAPTTDLSGFTPNVESLIGMGPDLVVVAEAPVDLVDGLDAVGVPLLVLPAATTLEDSYSQLDTLGRATGHLVAATEVTNTMKKRVADVLAKVKKRATPLTYYHELDDTLFTATSKTFIGSIYSQLGLTNIADPADREGGGYPQLSQEFLFKADPDLIFLADVKCCGQTAAIASARPGWSSLEAVRNGNVFELDDDISQRWGPRIVELLQQVADATAKVPAKS